MRRVLLADRAMCPACHQRFYSAHVRTEAWFKCLACKGWYFVLLIPPHMAAGYLAGLLGDVDASDLLTLLWPHHGKLPLMELYAQPLTVGSRNERYLSISATASEADAQRLDTTRDILHSLLRKAS